MAILRTPSVRHRAIERLVIGDGVCQRGPRVLDWRQYGDHYQSHDKGNDDDEVEAKDQLSHSRMRCVPSCVGMRQRTTSVHILHREGIYPLIGLPVRGTPGKREEQMRQNVEYHVGYQNPVHPLW